MESTAEPIVLTRTAVYNYSKKTGRYQRKEGTGKLQRALKINRETQTLIWVGKTIEHYAYISNEDGQYEWQRELKEEEETLIITYKLDLTMQPPKLSKYRNGQAKCYGFELYTRK